MLKSNAVPTNLDLRTLRRGGMSWIHLRICNDLINNKQLKHINNQCPIGTGGQYLLTCINTLKPYRQVVNSVSKSLMNYAYVNKVYELERNKSLDMKGNFCVKFT